MKDNLLIQTVAKEIKQKIYVCTNLESLQATNNQLYKLQLHKTNNIPDTKRTFCRN